VELSSRPVEGLDDALDNRAVESAQVHGALARAGCVGVDTPMDLVRRPGRILDLGRYRAMEAFFDAGGTAGRWMMCNTASVQVNLGFGAAPGRTWRVANLLAPILLATFANSPGHDAHGRPWASLRRAAWEGMDRSRTATPSLAGDPARAWLGYLLDADVMLVRDGELVTAVPPGTPFRAWMAGALHRLPTPDDLRYHATTLFPPVRPRGWLELRVLDALPPDVLEIAAVTVLTALHPDVIDRTDEQLAGLEPELEPALGAAARRGLADEGLAATADALLALVCRHLHLVTGRTDRRRAVQRYVEDHVAARRQPNGLTLAEALSMDAVGGAPPRLRPEVGPPTRTRPGVFSADRAAVPALLP
jgi:glutamate--cysteine ligase